MLSTLRLTLLLTLLFSHNVYVCQERPIEIEDERQNNRLILYAINKNLYDVDVAIEVRGTGFRKRAGRQRWFRVPARSKAAIETLVVERDKVPVYVYTLEVNDSLSQRVVRPPFELIKVYPLKKVTLFLTDNCKEKCDSLINPLNASPFLYDSIKISDNQAVKDQISNALIGGQKRLDTMTTPIVMLGGKMYLQIADYETLIKKMEEED